MERQGTEMIQGNGISVNLGLEDVVMRTPSPAVSIESVDGYDFEDDSRPEGGQATGRYFTEGGPSSGGPICHNCGQQGHISRECGNESNQPCFLCGQLGHSRSACPHDLCYNCLKPGHQSRDCPLPRKRRFLGEHELCNKCSLPGHLQRECPLAWRQYVFCRKVPSKAILSREVSSLKAHCYWCSDSGHFGDECPDRKRGANYSIFHKPSFEYLEMVCYKLALAGSSHSQTQLQNTGNPRHSGYQHRGERRPEGSAGRRFSRSPTRNPPTPHRNMTLDNRPGQPQQQRRPSPSRKKSPQRSDGAPGQRAREQGGSGRGHRPMYRGGYRRFAGDERRPEPQQQ